MAFRFMSGMVRFEIKTSSLEWLLWLDMFLEWIFQQSLTLGIKSIR